MITATPAALPTLAFRALGTTAVLVTTGDETGLHRAGAAVRRTLAAIDRTCSRFRADSEITRLHERAGRAATMSPLLAEAIDVAIRAAELTDGLVDPTVGAAVRALGYDRDFADIQPGDSRPPAAAVAVPGWWRLRREPGSRRLLLPRGVLLDLGATAKALAADRAARAAAQAADAGVLVDLGGDLAVAGPPPAAGWRIAIGDDHVLAETDPAATVTVTSGGLATSSTTRRRWRRGDRVVNHLVDPRTGESVVPVWRTVSVAAATCVDANTASTAAIVLGAEAPAWLRDRDLPARLVDVSGRVVTVAGWPAEGTAR